MNEGGRLIRLETETTRLRSDVQELTGSVDGVKGELSAFRESVAKEFGCVRADTAKEFGAVRTEMATRLGAMSTLIERNTRWLMVTGLTSAAALLTMFATVAHAMKWF